MFHIIDSTERSLKDLELNDVFAFAGDVLSERRSITVYRVASEYNPISGTEIMYVGVYNKLNNTVTPPKHGWKTPEQLWGGHTVMMLIHGCIFGCA